MRPGDRAASGAPSRAAAAAGVAMLVVSLACIAVITLTPAPESAPLPFWCIRCGARPGVDVLLNILMFTPIGAGLALLRVRSAWTLLLIVGTTVVIETLQYTFVQGRFGSARDIVANSVGGIAAWQIVLARRSIIFPSPANALALGHGAALAWIAAQLFTAWTMQIVAPPSPWWAQIKQHDFGFPEYFRGHVIRSSVGSVAILYSDQLAESDRVRAQLIDGEPLTARVTGVEPTAGAAPILLLAADDRLSEVAALGATGNDVFFRIRTRAATLGLRNPSIRLDDAFQGGSAKDTTTVAGRYKGGRYHISITSGARRKELTLAASPSWGWALVVPIPQYAFGAEVRMLTALWLGAAVGLAGFWTGQGTARAPSDTRAGVRLVSLVALGVAITIGLAAVPVALHLPVAHWSEWVAAAVGGACGWLLGWRVRARFSLERVVATHPA